MTRSFNRPASGMLRGMSAMRDIEEESEHSPPPIRLVQRVPLFTALGSKYPNLGDAEIKKVDNAFSKIFAPVFSGYRDHIIDKHLQKAGPGHIFMEVQEKLTQINEDMFKQVAEGQFDNGSSNAGGSGKDKGGKKKKAAQQQSRDRDQSMIQDDDSFEEDRGDFDDSSSSYQGKKSKQERKDQKGDKGGKRAEKFKD